MQDCNARLLISYFHLSCFTLVEVARWKERNKCSNCNVSKLSMLWLLWHIKTAEIGFLTSPFYSKISCSVQIPGTHSKDNFKIS